MANMHYCMFENTYNDLQAAAEKLTEDTEDMSETEIKYRQWLIELCKEIADDYADDNSN